MEFFSAEVFNFHPGLTAKDLAAHFNQLPDQDAQEDFYHAMADHYAGNPKQFPGFEGGRKVLTYAEIKAISDDLRDPNLDIRNKRRQSLGFQPRMPEGFLFPDAAANQRLTPENYYTLQEYDLYVGLDWIREQMLQKEPKEGIRYFLMPVVFQIYFDQGRQPIPDHQYKDLSDKLNCLFMDSLRQKERVLIAGILNSDNNHYVNYFLFIDPSKKTYSIFILDPSAEKQKGSKKNKEMEYANLFQLILEPQWGLPALVQPLLVTQQLFERDCGFLCLENLNNVLVQGKLFALTDGRELQVNCDQLRVNGNKNRYYDDSKRCYAYSSELVRFDLQVREEWAERLTVQNGELVTAAKMVVMKAKPTLDDPFESDFNLEPYDYTEKVKVTYEREVSEQLRSSLALKLWSLDGGALIEDVKKRYRDKYHLPTDLEVGSYTVQLVAKMRSIEFQGQSFSGEQLLNTFGSLDSVVYQVLMDSLRDLHATVLMGKFSLYLKKYGWEAGNNSWGHVFDDFFSLEVVQRILEFLPGQEGRECQSVIRESYAAEVQSKYLNSKLNSIRGTLPANFPAILDEIEFSAEDNVESFLESLVRQLCDYFDSKTAICKLNGSGSLLKEVQIAVQIQSKILREKHLPVLLQKIQAEKVENLVEFHSQYFCPVGEGLQSERYGHFIYKVFENEIKKAIAARLNAVIVPIMDEACREVGACVFSQERSLWLRLNVLPEVWRTEFKKHLEAKPALKAVCLSSDAHQKKVLQRLDEYCKNFIKKLIDEAVKTYIDTRPLNFKLLFLRTPESSQALWAIFAEQVLLLQPQTRVSQDDQDKYHWLISKRIESLLKPVKGKYLDFNQKLELLHKALMDLQSSLKNKFSPVEDLLNRIRTHKDKLDQTSESLRLKDFDRVFAASKRDLCQDLTRFLQLVAPSFIEGDTNPHGRTYCLRPFLAQLFKLKVVKSGKCPSMVVALESIVSIDERIEEILDRFNDDPHYVLKDLPKLMQTNVPLLPQPAKFHLPSLDELKVGHLISLVHLIDSDLYKASSWGAWLNCLKPLRNKLVELVNQEYTDPNCKLDLLLSEITKGALPPIIKEFKQKIAEYKFPAPQNDLLDSISRQLDSANAPEFY